MDGIRITLDSTDRESVVEAIRKQGLAFLRYQQWGVVEDAAAALMDFAHRVSEAEAVWELAREPWVIPQRMAQVVGALSEGFAQDQIDRKSLSGLRSAAPISTDDIETAIRVHKTLSELLPKGQREHDLAEAERLKPLARSLRRWEPPLRNEGRPLEPKSVIEEELALILGDRRPAERRRWAACIVSDFLGEPVTPSEVYNRERARAGRARQGA